MYAAGLVLSDVEEITSDVTFRTRNSLYMIEPID